MKGKRFTHKNKKGRVKEFIVTDEEPKWENGVLICLGVQYATNPAPRKRYERVFNTERMKWL
jgi:hypothetical protein